MPALALYFVWILFLDGPHLWATLSRTYFDREERSARRALLVRAFAWALLPLGTIAWGFATGQRMPWILFLTFVQVWAYWHVVRQHYGFLVLYQRKEGEPAGAENRFDQAVFYTSMLAPLVSYALRHPMVRHDLGLPATLSFVESAIATTAAAAALAAVGAHVVRELARRAKGLPFNTGKNLFLAACVPLHLVALLHPTWSLRINPLAFTVIVTSFHNVQYNAIVWRFGRRRYQGERARERYGAAAKLFANAVPWYLLGVALTVALRYASWSFDGRFWPFTAATATGRALPGPFTATEYVNAWWWIVAMHHYYLDQHIWRVSRDASVRAGLGLRSNS